HDILGTDVLRDHGWTAGRDRADVDLPSGAVHCLVSGEAACRHGLSARSGYRLARLEISQHRETGCSCKEVLERMTAQDGIRMDRVVVELEQLGERIERGGSDPVERVGIFLLVTGQGCCGRRASLAHFLLLATRFRSLQGELVYAAVDWAAAACLRSACHRSADE